MDPITIAMASFSAVKAGVSAGKEITSLAKDIGSLFQAIDDIKDDHSKKRDSVFANSNEEALSTFVARKKAEDMEEELRQIVIATRGFSAWGELVELRKEIRVRNKKEREEKRKKTQKMVENILIYGGIGLIFLFICGFSLLILLKYMGKI